MLVEPPVSPYLPARVGANLGRTLLFGASSITGYALTRVCRDNLVAVAGGSAKGRGSRWQAADAEDGTALAALLERERPAVVIWAPSATSQTKTSAAWAMAINVRRSRTSCATCRTARLVYLLRPRFR
jgi:dTDP-4-dehydrorhamnose reductase